MKLLVPQRYIKDGELTGYELLVYVYIRALFSPDGIEEIIFDTETIVSNIYGSDTDRVSERAIKNISAAIRGLIDKKVFDGYCIKRGLYFIEAASLRFELNDYFAVVYTEDLIVFRNINSGVKMLPDLFRCYLMLLCTFNNSKGMSIKIGDEIMRGVIGNQSQQYLATLLDVSDRTVRRWIKILVDAEIIYTIVPEGFNQKNFYGRYIHKEAIDKHFKKDEGSEWDDIDMEELFG